MPRSPQTGLRLWGGEHFHEVLNAGTKAPVMNITEYWNHPLRQGVLGPSETRGEGPKTVVFQRPAVSAQSEPATDLQLDMTVAPFAATRCLPDHIAIKTRPARRPDNGVLNHCPTPHGAQPTLRAP